MTHLSIGDIFREEVKDQTSKYAKILTENMKAGRVGVKEMTIELLRKAMTAVTKTSGCTKFLVDGFPRSLDRALLFEKSIGQPVCVLYLECEDRTLRERLGKRREGRSDDNAETVEKRLNEFERDISPVLQHYKSMGVLIDVDGSRSREEVREEIESKLQRFIATGSRRHS